MKKANLFLMITAPILFFSACSDKEEPKKRTETKEDWYSETSIDHQTWMFQELKSSQTNVTYLVTGSERAIMFDTGTGENRGYNGTKMMYKIKEVSDLPVTLLLSHFHFDHNQNIHEFENVAFPDIDFLREAVDEEDTYHFTANDLFEGATPSSVEVNQWLPLETDIDLGGRFIQLVNLPGHTKESVVIFDHESKMVFLGDFLYSGPIFIFDDQDFSVYVSSMTKLIDMIDESYALYGAHGAPKVSYQTLLRARDFISCIADGEDCYSEFTSNVLGRPARIYRSLEGPEEVLLFLSD